MAAVSNHNFIVDELVMERPNEKSALGAYCAWVAFNEHRKAFGNLIIIDESSKINSNFELIFDD